MTSGIINGQNIIKTIYMEKQVITKITFAAQHALGISWISHMNMIISHYKVSFSIEGNWGSEMANPFSEGHKVLSGKTKIQIHDLTA